jgi:hypothetical protein
MWAGAEYLLIVKRELVLFGARNFATAAQAQALHFKLLLGFLLAGFLVQNVAPAVTLAGRPGRALTVMRYG